MRYRVLPYMAGSRSAKALATAMGGKVLRLVGSTFKPRPEDTVINWGNSNYSSRIRDVSDKLAFFQKFSNTGLLPAFWQTKEDIPDEAFPIVCRTILSGHSGAGIHIAYCRSELVDARLFVKYEKKRDEYRVHLGRAEARAVQICVQRKAVPTGTTPSNWQVRNHGAGFVYTREGFTVPGRVLEAAERVFEAAGLDFGAVDVIYNERKERAYVLEINTAPGLEGTTVTDYANFFNALKESA